jgi:hypothetical protein
MINWVFATSPLRIDSDLRFLRPDLAPLASRLSLLYDLPLLSLVPMYPQRHAFVQKPLFVMDPAVFQYVALSQNKKHNNEEAEEDIELLTATLSGLCYHTAVL